MKVRCEMCRSLTIYRNDRDAQLCGICLSVLAAQRKREGIPMQDSVDWDRQVSRIDEEDRMNGQAQFYRPRD